MPTPIEIQAQIAEIEAAIASPERQVTLGSQNVTYRTVDDLKKARALLEGQLRDALGTTRRPKQYKAVYMGRGHD